jgi:xanthine dehydrogenase YagT iron-sulfur-binding subunit
VTSELSLRVNGEAHRLTLDNRATLLDVLRERLGLTGTKKGCDHGQCGACTVLIDGRRVNSCLQLAVAAQGREIVTIEGLAATHGALDPVQAAFLEHDGFQCGYCTPGQICSAVGAIREADLGWPSNVTGDMRRARTIPLYRLPDTQTGKGLDEPWVSEVARLDVEAETHVIGGYPLLDPGQSVKVHGTLIKPVAEALEVRLDGATVAALKPGTTKVDVDTGRTLPQPGSHSVALVSVDGKGHERVLAALPVLTSNADDEHTSG